jgi:tripartite-type tricarboxylate transporter receptor subunit TctC
LRFGNIVATRTIWGGSGMRRTSRLVWLAIALAATPCGAQDLYQGKSIDLLIGADAGGGYDIAGRAMARYLGRHIAGSPTIIVKNMAGATGLTMINYLANVAARDGTVIGLPEPAIVYEKLLGTATGANVRFDTGKLLWIGTPVQETFVTFVWATTEFRSVEDLKRGESLMSAISADGENVTLPILMNRMIGTRMKPIPGYQGQAGAFVAVERGEVQGNTTGFANLAGTKADWLRDGKIRILIQYALNPLARLKDVPLALDLAPSEEDRAVLRFLMAKYAMARPLVAPPDLPPQRIAALRAGFAATMQDEEFRADAARLGLDINPVGGAEIAALVAGLNATQAAIIARAKTLLGKPPS